MFTEYLKLLPKGLKNADKVIAGIYNSIQLEYGNLPEDEKGEILRRRLICQNCPLNSILAKESKEYFDIFGKYYDGGREEFHCSICNCGINFKTASLGSDCGIKDDEKTKDLEYKWVSYKK